MHKFFLRYHLLYINTIGAKACKLKTEMLGYLSTLGNNEPPPPPPPPSNHFSIYPIFPIISRHYGPKSHQICHWISSKLWFLEIIGVYYLFSLALYISAHIVRYNFICAIGIYTVSSYFASFSNKIIIIKTLRNSEKTWTVYSLLPIFCIKILNTIYSFIFFLLRIFFQNGKWKFFWIFFVGLNS